MSHQIYILNTLLLQGSRDHMRFLCHHQCLCRLHPYRRRGFSSTWAQRKDSSNSYVPGSRSTVFEWNGSTWLMTDQQPVFESIDLTDSRLREYLNTRFWWALINDSSQGVSLEEESFRSCCDFTHEPQYEHYWHIIYLTIYIRTHNIEWLTLSDFIIHTSFFFFPPFFPFFFFDIIFATIFLDILPRAIFCILVAAESNTLTPERVVYIGRIK